MIKINRKAIILAIVSAFIILFFTCGKVNATNVSLKAELYETLKAPHLNANVRLDDDITLKETDVNVEYNIASDSTFDLNGHTINTANNQFIISFKNDNCKLTIIDSVGGGKISAKDGTKSLFQVTNINNDEDYSGCKIEINGANLEGPTDRNPIIETIASQRIEIMAKNTTFTTNYNNGTVFSDGFNLKLDNTVAMSTCEEGNFYIAKEDTTKISEIIDENSEIWVDGVREYTDSLDTEIGAVICKCNSAIGIEIKPKNECEETRSVDTISELKEAIQTPEVKTIKLNDDIKTTEDLVIIINGNEKILDLNGCWITLETENKINVIYKTAHNFTLKGEVRRSGIEAIDSNVEMRSIFSPSNNTNKNVKMIVDGTTIESTSKWIFADTNKFKLIIDNGDFLSRDSLFNFNNEASGITINRLTLRNENSDASIQFAFSEGEYSNRPISEIIGDESKLIYTNRGTDDYIEYPKTTEGGHAYPENAILTVMPIKGLEIKKVQLPTKEYGYGEANFIKDIVTIKNTSDRDIEIEDIILVNNSGNFVLEYNEIDTVNIRSGREETLSRTRIKSANNLTPDIYTAEIAVYTTEGDEYRGKVEFEVTKIQPTLSLNISDWTYDKLGATAVAPTFNNNVELSEDELAEGKQIEDIEKIEYAVKPEEGSNAQPVFSTEVPTHAGKYIVKYTTEETDYYFAGTATKEFEITRKEMVPQISVDEENYTYTGTQIKPEVIVKITDGQEITLVKGEDYTVEYVDNINKGEGTIKVKSAATSNYILKDYEDKEVFEKKFNIFAKEIQASDVEVTDRMGYTGQALTPDVKVRVNGKALVKDTEYTVSFEGQDRKPGQQIDITVEGKGNYTGTVIKHTNIIEKMKQGLSFATATVNKKYTDSKFTIVLTHNVGDGVISYKSSNTNVVKINSKTGEATIVGVGNAEIIATASETNLYKQTETKYTLNVRKADYDTSKIKFENMAFPFDGKSHSIVANGIPTGVRVTYTNNEKTDVGTYQVTASFTGDYAHYNSIPNRTAVLKITNKNIANSTVSGIKDKTYTGKNLTQSLVIKDGNTTLKEGIDYTVAYNSNKKIGIATITIIGKGNYAGIITRTFKINPKGTSLKKLTAGSKQFKATWKAQKTQTTGYEVQYSTNKNFKSGNKKVNIKKNKTTSSTVKKLKAKKKYYVRIRTYKNVNGKKFYSDWSKVLNVKTKK